MADTGSKAATPAGTENNTSSTASSCLCSTVVCPICFARSRLGPHPVIIDSNDNIGLPPVASRLLLPVGFGGFHVAALWSRHPNPFLFVYDCGALGQNHARSWGSRVGQFVAAHGFRFSLVVLSHTDLDHVCGLDSLAQRTGIDTLMLPYLSWQFRAAQLAAYGSRNTPNWYKALLGDPLKWAQSRGVRSVVFVKSGSLSNDDGREPPAEFLDTQEPVLLRGGRELPDGATTITSGERLLVPIDGRFNWYLVPIFADAKAPDVAKRKLFAAVDGLTERAVFEGLSKKSSRGSRSLRSRLASIYKKHWGGTNASSLMMLLSPSGVEGGGWLCTGDANLKDSTNLQLVKQTGGRLLQNTDAIQVPHHGSGKNLDDQSVLFLEGLSHNLVRWFVSTGKNQWKYPTKKVADACQKRTRWCRVDTNSNEQEIRGF